MSERKVKNYPLPGFGATLRKAREAKGMLQKEVADAMGTKKGMISLWECEKNWFSDENLKRICAVLDLDPPLPERNSKGRRATSRANCERCGKVFPVFYGEKYCSRVCANAAMSERPGYNWRGGKTMTAYGYVLVHRPEHPAADKSGYVLEHRLVMEEMIGRQLEKREHVHHKNADRTDNRPENLELWTTDKSANHVGARVNDLILDSLREEIRKIVREELIAAGVLQEQE